MAAEKSDLIVVVGGGLAGLSAAFEASKQGKRVLIIEKNVVGGNSAKATSGINAVFSKAQTSLIKASNLIDSIELFSEDVQKSGHSICKPDLVHTLTALSGPSLDELCDTFGLSLTDIKILGGHQAQRTHRFPPKDGRVAPVGWTIISAMKKKLAEKIAANEMSVWEKSRVVDLSIESSTDIYGNKHTFIDTLTVEKMEENEPVVLSNFAAVIFAAGGYAADSSDSSILAEVRPDLIGYPTTNDNFASGDLVQLGMRRGLRTIHLDKVQLHPSGFVDPKDPMAIKKFLCPEVMRGVGAVMVNLQGERFCDELKPRDKVSAAISTFGASAREWGLTQQEDRQKLALLVISQESARAFGIEAFNFYVSKGFITEIKDEQDLQRLCPHLTMNALRSTLNDYSKLASENTTDRFGKKIFPDNFDSYESSFYVAYITPCLHFSMGGLEIDSTSRALSFDLGKSVSNLFVAGETAGGTHGANRLGGNGCLESLVFGQLSARVASTLNSSEKGIFPPLTALFNTNDKFRAVVYAADRKSITVSLPQANMVGDENLKFSDIVVESLTTGKKINLASEAVVEDSSNAGVLKLSLDVPMSTPIHPGDKFTAALDLSV